MKSVSYYKSLNKVAEISEAETAKLTEVTDTYVFRSNSYYNSLINWQDPDDPIRRLIIPSREELNSWGRLDAANEALYTKAPGLEHKYANTALLLVNDVCAAYCRFCFRKRLFMDGNDEVVRDITAGLAYIREHKEICNVLLTGGDPLILSSGRLSEIFRRIREIDHVHIIRVGSKIPAHNPYRIIDDPQLPAVIADHTSSDKKIYFMLHFSHPRELTDVALQAIQILQQSGAIVVNQTPMIRGINDNEEVLAKLLTRLSHIGVPPYYVFQCRPTSGNKMFSVPLEEAWQIFERSRRNISGLAKRARFVISHETGKLEVVGLTQRRIFFRYHQAAKPQDLARFMVFPRNPDAYWFDDYTDIAEDLSVYNPEDIAKKTADYRGYGPE